MSKRILFVENRYKTYLLEPIAKKLDELGHDIFWIIQNKEFNVNESFTKYTIPLPPKKMKNYEKDLDVEEVIKVDRQYNFFNSKSTSYFYYYNEKIEEILERVQPKIVFGEATAFHELLLINNCKKRNILYLNPSTSRYPTGRFSFYKYDTLQPCVGSNDVLDDMEASKIINEIVHGKVAPDYMKKVKTSSRKRAKDKLLKLSSYFKGEHYNTPHPYTKFKIERQKKKNIKNWNDASEIGISETEKTKVLYALQMQPEANIDVWGKKYRDQKELILNIAKTLPSNAVLYVKPNPKSKYELTEELIDYILKLDNVKIIHHSVKMYDVLDKIDLVITVTGTIAIECILSNKPVITLVKTINNRAENCEYVESLGEELPKILRRIEEGNFMKLDNQEKISFINILNKTSYKGKISDPFEDKSCVSQQNVSHLVNAFEDVIQNS